jgi:hypothetical protein
MDPNWFYSTLAQSTAAIVGLAGGFLFTWLLSRRVEVAVERRPYIDGLHGIIGRLEDLRNRAETVRVQVEQVLQKIHEQRAAGCTHERLTIPQFELLSHTAYEVPHPTEDDLTVLETLPPMYEQLRDAIVTSREDLARAILKGKPLEARGAPGYTSRELTFDPFHWSGINPQNFWSGLRQQQDHAIWRWQEVAREYSRLASAVNEFRQKLVPASIYFLIGVLFVRVGAGVVAPLAFLSAYAGWSKWILLSISAPLVLAFVAYLGYEVWRLRHAADLSRDTL